MPEKASEPGGPKVKLSAQFLDFLERRFQELGGRDLKAEYAVRRSTFDNWKRKLRENGEIWARRDVVAEIFWKRQDLPPASPDLQLPEETVKSIQLKLATLSRGLGESGGRVVASIDLKSALRRAVRQYLDAEEPERVEEFEIVFDDVFLVVEGRLREKQPKLKTSGESGIPFDPGMVAGTVISSACWIGFSLLTAASEYATKRKLAEVLDQAEDELKGAGVNAKMLHRLRHIIQGICNGL